MSPTSTPARQGSMITTSGALPSLADVGHVIDRLGIRDFHAVERLLENRANAGSDHRMVIDDQAARRSLRARGHWSQHTSVLESGPRCGGSVIQGRGSRRMISRVTAPATRTPVAATVAAACTAFATASPDCCGAGSAGRRAHRGLARGRARSAPRGRRRLGGCAGFGARRAVALARRLARAAFEARAGFAAAFPAASAFTAALLAVLDGLPPESRFALRFPGRERGRFPSTPSSSAMAGDSSRCPFWVHGSCDRTDRVVWRNQLVDWLVSGNSASGRLTSLSVALVCTSTV